MLAVGLLVGHVALQLLSSATGHDYIYGLLDLFHLDRENNLPSYFSSMLLLLSALAMWVRATVAAGSGHRDAGGWRLLAILVLLMSIDESASMHELAVEPSRRLLGGHATGLLYFAWVLPATMLLLALFWLLSGFLRRLPPEVLSRLVAAGALFFGGAIGVELFGGRHFEEHGADLAYTIGWVALEEGMEMAGAVLLLHASLHGLALKHAEIRLGLVARPPATAATARPLPAGTVAPTHGRRIPR